MERFIIHDRIDVIPERSKHLRIDRRALLARPRVKGVVIDEPKTILRDDAFWVDQSTDGMFHAVVSIADVGSSLVLASSEMKGVKDAWRVPRPPVKKLSLQQNTLRPTQTVNISIDQDFRVQSASIHPTHMLVDNEFTRNIAQKLLRQQSSTEVGDMLKKANILSTGLFLRRNFGEVFDSEAYRYGLYKDEYRDFLSTQSNVAQVLSEILITANLAFTKYAVEHNIPIIFRNQTHPHFDQTLKRDKDVITDEIPYPILRRMKQYDSKQFIQEKSTTPKYHMAIGTYAYASMTSPLREVTDAINWQQMAAAIEGRKLPYTKVELSEYLKENDSSPLEERTAWSESTTIFVSPVITRSDENSMQFLPNENSNGFELERSKILDIYSEGQISCDEAYQIFSTAPEELFDEVKVAVASWLIQHPDQSKYFFQLMQKRSVTEVIYVEQMVRGAMTSWITEAQWNNSTTTFTGKGKGSTKREAQNLAITHMIADILEVEVDESIFGEEPTVMITPFVPENPFIGKSKVEFEEEIEVAMTVGKISEKLAEELKGRIEVGELNHYDVYKLFFTEGEGSEWDEVRVKMKGLMKKEVGVARKVLKLAQQNQLVPDIELIQENSQQKNTYYTRARTIIDGVEYSSSLMQGKDKRTAEDKAYTNLLLRLPLHKRDEQSVTPLSFVDVDTHNE